MGKVVLLSCVSKKRAVRSKAKDMYISPLFKYNYKYAKSMNPDKIFVLSAEYGLLGIDQEIEPYNKTLNTMSMKDIKTWADDVLGSLEQKTDIKRDEFIFLAGERYRKYLLPHLVHTEIPLKGLGIGKQLGFLKKKVTHYEQRML